MQNNEKRFHVFAGVKDNLPMIAVIDRNYRDFPNKDLYPCFLWISIPLRDKRNDGQSSVDEDKVLEKFEVQIENKLEAEADIFHVGRLTWNGFREYFYYIANAERVNKVLQALVEKPPFNRGFQYEIEKDITWNRVAEMFGW